MDDSDGITRHPEKGNGNGDEPEDDPFGNEPDEPEDDEDQEPEDNVDIDSGFTKRKGVRK